MRIFEKAAFKAFLLSAGRLAHYPGEQPNASIEQDKRGRLAAGQNVVADRHRPHRIAAPGPAASSRTSACVSGSPLGVIASSGSAGARSRT